MPAKSRRSFSVRFSFTRPRELNQRALPTSQATAQGTARPRAKSLLREDMPSSLDPSSRFLLVRGLRPGSRFRLERLCRLGGDGAGEKPEKDPANDSHEQFLSLGVRAQLPPLAMAKQRRTTLHGRREEAPEDTRLDAGGLNQSDGLPQSASFWVR
jgi:hypothetical protein